MITILIAPALSTLGVDLSTLCSQYSCLKGAGFSFAIPRGYCSYGAVDPNINTNIKNSVAAGLTTDIYMFPCRGKSAQDQVNQLINSVGLNRSSNKESIRIDFDIESKGLRAGVGQVPQEPLLFEGQSVVDLESYRQDNDGSGYGMIWIDVETNPSSGCSWASHAAADNCNYLGQLISAIQGKGKKVGIYASQYMWTQIMGSRTACTKFTNIPIWYAHYDGSASFSDWSTVSFGGWSKPAIKQYQGDKVSCNTGVDFNFY